MIGKVFREKCQFLFKNQSFPVLTIQQFSVKSQK